MLILGLDMSSTCIGHALDTGDAFGAEELRGTIADKCAAAEARVAWLLDRYAPALVVIESPVGRFAKSVIPQARVSGAVLALLARRRALWVEVAPTAAKLALCDDGAATKAEMVDEAARRLLLPRSDIRPWRGKVYAHAANGTRAFSEDEADAYALALAGRSVRVEVKEAA